MKKQSTISAHVIQFSRFLRGHGFSCGPIEETAALRALRLIPYSRPSFFKEALRSTFVKNKQQLDRFDDLYLQYWAEVRRAENSKQKEVPEEKPKPVASAPSIQVIKKWLHGNHEQDLLEVASYDTSEIVSASDFSSFSGDDLSHMLKLSRSLVKKLANKRGRRYTDAKRKDVLALRKMIRRNIARSDEIIFLNYKKRKVEKLKLVLICDVSRSMELYTKFLIHFMYGLNQASATIETFLFSTRLARVTGSLREYDFGKVLEDLKMSFDGWSGGTKIGSCLREFSDLYGSQLLDQKTKVVILSDGWDTGEPLVVSYAMESIQRKCHKVIWLNPLAGNSAFKPETACLQAALPHVDIMQAANSTEDLSRLISVL